MVWVGRDPKGHLAPAPLPWAGTSSTSPGCSADALLLKRRALCVTPEARRSFLSSFGLEASLTGPVRRVCELGWRWRADGASGEARASAGLFAHSQSGLWAHAER